MSDTPTTDLELAGAPPAAVPSPEADHLNLLWKLARITTNTEMVPRALRGRPDAALAVMVYGHELGLRPMTSLREVYIIEGTPSCSAKLMRAQILRAGHILAFRVQTRERVVLYGERTDGRRSPTTGRTSSEVEWTLEDVRIAGLLGKDNWKRYPRAMLKARATSELARDIFPDLTIGYTPEELARFELAGEYDFVDVEDEDGDPELDEVDEDTPPHVVAATMLDAEDALDAEWLAEARAEEES